MSNRVHPMTMSKEGVEMAAVPGGGHTSLSLEEDSIDQQCMKHSPPDPGFFEKGNISNICTFLVMCAGLGMRFGMNGDWDDNVAVREWRGGESCGERARSPRHPRARSTILIFPSFTKENFARLSFFFCVFVFLIPARRREVVWVRGRGGSFGLRTAFYPLAGVCCVGLIRADCDDLVVTTPRPHFCSRADQVRYSQ